MNIELESMAIEMPRVAGHPNREPFRGVLTLVDAASDKPPAGARGHRVLLTRFGRLHTSPSLARRFSAVIRRHTGIRGSSCPKGRNHKAHQIRARVRGEMQR